MAAMGGICGFAGGLALAWALPRSKARPAWAQLFAMAGGLGCAGAAVWALPEPTLGHTTPIVGAAIMAILSGGVILWRLCGAAEKAAPPVDSRQAETRQSETGTPAAAGAPRFRWKRLWLPLALTLVLWLIAYPIGSIAYDVSYPYGILGVMATAGGVFGIIGGLALALTLPRIAASPLWRQVLALSGGLGAAGAAVWALAESLLYDLGPIVAAVAMFILSVAAILRRLRAGEPKAGEPRLRSSLAGTLPSGDRPTAEPSLTQGLGGGPGSEEANRPPQPAVKDGDPGEPLPESAKEAQRQAGSEEPQREAEERERQMDLRTLFDHAARLAQYNPRRALEILAEIRSEEPDYPRLAAVEIQARENLNRQESASKPPAKEA